MLHLQSKSQNGRPADKNDKLENTSASKLVNKNTHHLELGCL